MTLRYKDLQPISTEELRIGNYVWANGIQYELKSVGEKLCKVKALYSSDDVITIKNTADLRPITVNETRIEEMGFFTKIQRNIWINVPNDFLLKYDGEDSFQLISQYHDVEYASGKFIHHLQNLITDLTLKPE